MSLSHQHIEHLEPRQLLAGGRETFDLNGGWKFIKSDVPAAAAKLYNDSSWADVKVPHTYNGTDAQDGGANYFRGATWYRRRWRAPESTAGRQMYLRFEGVGQTAEVYVNGALAGKHEGAYAAFLFDLNPFVKVARANYIAVRVSNALNQNIAPVDEDWNIAGGIYRDVSIFTTDTAHVDPTDHAAAGAYFTQKTSTASAAAFSARTLLRNTGGKLRKFDVITSILDAGGNVVESQKTRVNLLRKSTATLNQTLTIDNPKLWDGVRSPYLYTARTELRNTENTLLDSISQKIGVRTFSVHVDNGLTLNGKYYDLKGVAFHSDRPGKSHAVTDADRREDVNLAVEVGSTGLRLGHYQHDQTTYQLANEKGLVVWAEIPIYGEISTTQGFENNAKLQLTELIRQNYNHPSIFFWSVGNELEDDAPTQQLITKLDALANAEDPARPSTYATNYSNRAVNRITDTTGFNRYDGWYSGEADFFGSALSLIRRNHPGVKIALSEFGAGGSIFHHINDPNPTRPAETRNPFHPEQYLNVFHEKAWSQVANFKWLWGKFVWALADFASDRRGEGDANGRVDKGLVTYDRKTKKDAFYFYKANWTNSPVLHITSRRYVERTDAQTEVKIYSNFDAVELKLNGQVVSTNTSKSFSVFKWSNISLQPGDNVVQVKATRNGQTFTDTVTWTYTPPAGRAAFIATTSFSNPTSAQQRVTEDVLFET
jgi:beta-galactosidase